MNTTEKIAKTNLSQQTIETIETHIYQAILGDISQYCKALELPQDIFIAFQEGKQGL